MHSRRHFLAGTAAAAAGGFVCAGAPVIPVAADEILDESRGAWVRRLERLARPVLMNLSAGTLRERMPIECPKGKPEDRRRVTHLEAVGRTLTGIAPWLETSAQADTPEGRIAAELAAAARRGLANAVDKNSPDFIDFEAGSQNLVDAAFLCHAFLRAPRVLWDPLPQEVKRSLIASIEATRKVKPSQSNWLLFTAMVEAWLQGVGADWLRDRVEPALARHEEWYKGDGAYGDGPPFHWDYYNSYVIQPMLVEVVERLAAHEPRWAVMREPVLARAVRYAAIQERFIAPDGTFPPIGRSLTYRCGAFHHLAFMALRRQLPAEVSPAQVRGALAGVIRRTLDAPDTFDEQGWLRVGLAGHQPSLAESYISTGSLYLCTAAFLPLGLPPGDPFWTSPPADWTQRRIWAGHDAPADHALK